eukprot:c21591_g1_i1 orf=174-1181(-)
MFEPPCVVHGDSRGGHGDRKEFISGSEELKIGIPKFDYAQQQLWKDSERGDTITGPGYSEEQQVWEESFVDELVCKLVSQFCFPENSTVCVPERGVKELSLQDDEIIKNLQLSDSCLDGETSIHVLSPGSSPEAPSPFKESKGLLSQGVVEGAVLNPQCSDAPAKLKSALRGGHEKSGLGPRPKLHVTWDPDVYDPPCTSTSHTSNKSRRRHHHHPKSDNKNRHKGKGSSSHADSHKKLQKKMMRRLRHTGETFLSGPTVAAQKGIQNNSLMLKEYITPSLDDFTLKSVLVNPFILPSKGCYLNPVLSLGERELVTLDMIQGCHPRHVQTHKLCL